MPIVDAIYHITNFEREDQHPELWYLPYKIVSPFDRTTYFGFVGTLWICMCAGYGYISTMSCVCTYFVSNCFFVEACLKHFKQKILAIQEEIEHGTFVDQSIHEKFKDAISFHNKTIE